ncbi:MAG: dockerin type I domain-containing protein, partial [Planctomycetota bacterium]
LMHGNAIEIVAENLHVSVPSETLLVELAAADNVSVSHRDGSFELSTAQGVLTKSLTISNPSIQLVAREAVSNVVLDADAEGPGSLTISRSSPLTQLTFSTSLQRLASEETRFGRRIVTGTIGELWVAADFTFRPDHHFMNPFDVNGDERVSASDALAIMNRLSSPQFSRDGLVRGDVNGDGVWSPLDALLVINHLESRSIAEGEFRLDPAEDLAVWHTRFDNFWNDDRTEWLQWSDGFVEALP